MAEKIEVILLMLALLIGGFLMGFNLIETLIGIDLGLGFSDIISIQSGIWIIISRLVGLALIALSIYTIVNIIRD